LTLAASIASGVKWRFGWLRVERGAHQVFQSPYLDDGFHGIAMVYIKEEKQHTRITQRVLENPCQSDLGY